MFAADPFVVPDETEAVQWVKAPPRGLGEQDDLEQLANSLRWRYSSLAFSGKEAFNPTSTQLYEVQVSVSARRRR